MRMPRIIITVICLILMSRAKLLKLSIDIRYKMKLAMNINILCCILALTSLSGCEMYKYGYVVINNKSDISISCLIPLEASYQSKSFMEMDVRDTIYDFNYKIHPSWCIDVPANSTRKSSSVALKERWERMFYNDTLYIEIFPKGVIYDYSLYEIITDKLILQEYKIAYEQFETLLLKDNAFYISYPPTPEMKDIKMWPPYEEAIKNAESLKP